MDRFFKTITWAGSYWLLGPLSLMIAVFLVREQRYLDAVLIMGGLSGTFLLSHLIKQLVARRRPVVQNLLIKMPPDFSFPSAHTAQIMAFNLTTAVIMGGNASLSTNLVLWSFSFLLILSVAISRIYLKVHYISDVLAGAILAVIWVLTLNWAIIWWGVRSGMG